jgi:hypothetical protein
MWSIYEHANFIEGPFVSVRYAGSPAPVRGREAGAGEAGGGGDVHGGRVIWRDYGK